jgi:hypothetical protein
MTRSELAQGAPASGEPDTFSRRPLSRTSRSFVVQITWVSKGSKPDIQTETLPFSGLAVLTTRVSIEGETNVLVRQLDPPI